MSLDLRRVGTIARREYVTPVRRKGFILTLILMPLYGIFATMMSALPALLASRSDESRVVAVVDPGRVLGVAPGQDVVMSTDYKARFFASFDEASKAFHEGSVRSILRIDPDYLTSGQTAQFRQPGGLLTARRLGPPYADFMRTRLLAERVDPKVSERILDPVGFKAHHRLAVVLLIHAVRRGVERQRVLLRRGQLLLDEHAQHAQFVGGEADHGRKCSESAAAAKSPTATFAAAAHP